MKSLVEVYDLQQQVKRNLSQKNYQNLERLFAPLVGPDLHKVLQIQFLFNPQVEEANEILQQLHAWQQEMPQSYYPYVFIAGFWYMTAANERGIQTMDRVTLAQRLRFSIANDQFFYWALKTLEFNPESVVTLNKLLEASGRFGIPDWLELPVNQPISFTCAHYDGEAREYISSFAGYSLPEGAINITLSTPTADEMSFIPLYWLRHILITAPEHIESRKTIIRFLSPRWYGDEKYEKVDQFLASDYCSGLSAFQIKILHREKEYDRLTAYNTLPSINLRKALEKSEKHFAELVNDHLSDEEDSLTRFEYIDFCYHILTTMPDDRQNSRDALVQSIYQSLHDIVRLASPWIIFYRATEVFNVLFSMMKIYEFEDKLNVFDNLSRQTRYRNLTSPLEVLYSALAANFPLSDVFLETQRESIERYYISAERNLDYGMFRLHIFILSKMGYAASIKPVIEKFATEYRGVNASILCYEIYHGNTPGLAQMFSVNTNIDKSNMFLDIAVQRRSSQAMLIKSRDLETLIEGNDNPSVKAELAIERERLLKLNIQSGDALSQYDYACSLIASSDEKQIRQGLFIEAPKVLLQARVRLDQLAYIAYLYAFCAFNARGMDKNLFVMDFWIKQAMQWDADPNYWNFLQKVKEGVALRPLYNYYVKRSKSKISEEMKNIMEHVIQ
ncbi:DUF4034 domain-containing protein [Pantoea sp. At-9b]|uniref:DUF4034 domain-containing protein n=1 Tax=Pantoea sp. (strain At-9b) TaxID=592316 RepID=UPI0001F2601A|nr:DUF4034 domain-containing protein [Pantoea sp. At-9b]ADU72667.1 hypothetical protein Pat9b_4698 [Pantoea sp. At-9b]